MLIFLVNADIGKFQILFKFFLVKFQVIEILLSVVAQRDILFMTPRYHDSRTVHKDHYWVGLYI